MFKRKLWLALAVVMLVLRVATAPAMSDNYPSKPIRIVVGFPPGGGTDIIARILGEKLSAALGQPVVIDNKPGAGAVLAAELVARSAPDGYTLMIGGGSAMTVNPAVYKTLSYDPVKDFVAITMVVQAPLIMAVHPSVPAKTIPELISYLKSHPGEVNYSSANMISRLAGEIFSQMSGGKVNAIPYRGGGPAVNGVLTRDVAMTIVDSGSVLTQIRGGLLRGLGVTTAARSRAVPELPAIAESVPGYDVGTWFGLFAPAGTPEAIVTKLNTEVVRIVAEVGERLSVATGGDPIGNTSEQFAAQIRSDIARFSKAARAANLEVQQ